MEWRDQGILLNSRRHGESAAIIEVFTPAHGRHAGVVRGGAGRRMAPILQPGAQLDVTWRARLADHIGSFTVEPVRSRAEAMGDRLMLAGLNAVVALLHFSLPERAAHAALYRHTENLLDLLGRADLWPLAYLRWEMTLLDELGYGLDLSRCAVTGAREGLVHVSPKSGRAVSAEGAGGWADRLLPLPPCLLAKGTAEDVDVVEALGVTGFFLSHHMAADLGDGPLPEARHRFVEALSRRASKGPRPGAIGG
jgi:DNA repair protein RecO (recombination protein O)